jgi:hypothetical protein
MARALKFHPDHCLCLNYGFINCHYRISLDSQSGEEPVN